jgi:hypothetical protein
MTNHTPEYINANDWFGTLPKSRQDFLRENKWEMTNAAFEAGREQLAAVTAQRDELLEALSKISAVGIKCESFQKQMAEVENIAFAARRIVKTPPPDAKLEGK